MPTYIIQFFEEGLFRFGRHLWGPGRIARPRRCIWCERTIVAGDLGYRAICLRNDTRRICARCIEELLDQNFVPLPTKGENPVWTPRHKRVNVNAARLVRSSRRRGRKSLGYDRTTKS